MINALKPTFRQFKWARVTMIRENETKVESFKFSFVSDHEKMYNQAIKNLITDVGNLVIRTTVNLPYEVNDKIEIGEDKFSIQRVGKYQMDVNELSLGLMKKNPSTEYVLELVS
jgi:hypothetical protein